MKKILAAVLSVILSIGVFPSTLVSVQGEDTKHVGFDTELSSTSSRETMVEIKRNFDSSRRWELSMWF